MLVTPYDQIDLGHALHQLYVALEIEMGDGDEDIDLVAERGYLPFRLVSCQTYESASVNLGLSGHSSGRGAKFRGALASRVNENDRELVVSSTEPQDAVLLISMSAADCFIVLHAARRRHRPRDLIGIRHVRTYSFDFDLRQSGWCGHYTFVAR